MLSFLSYLIVCQFRLFASDMLFIFNWIHTVFIILQITSSISQLVSNRLRFLKIFSRFSIQSTIFLATPDFRNIQEVKTRCHIAVLLLCAYVIDILFVSERHAASRRVDSRGTRSSRANSERCLVAT